MTGQSICEADLASQIDWVGISNHIVLFFIFIIEMCNSSKCVPLPNRYSEVGSILTETSDKSNIFTNHKMLFLLAFLIGSWEKFNFSQTERRKRLHVTAKNQQKETFCSFLIGLSDHWSNFCWISIGFLLLIEIRPWNEYAVMCDSIKKVWTAESDGQKIAPRK